jgi:hypothetical protein
MPQRTSEFFAYGQLRQKSGRVRVRGESRAQRNADSCSLDGTLDTWDGDEPTEALRRECLDSESDDSVSAGTIL